MKKSNLPLDTKGYPFAHMPFILSAQEYKKVYSEINQLYFAMYESQPFCTHTTCGPDGYVYHYWFENHGFNDYNIYLRVIDI